MHLSMYGLSPLQTLLVIWRHFVLHIPQQGNPHFGSVVTTENIADIVGFYLHLNLPLVISRSYTITAATAPMRTEE